VTHFVVPSTAVIPRPLDRTAPAHVQIFVPMDDEHTMFYGVFFSQDGRPVDAGEVRARQHVRPGIDLDRNYFRRASSDDMWAQDRAAMKAGNYTGIAGFTNQDMAVQESMGPIVDRTAEHLGTSDVAIIRMRRRLLDSVRQFSDGAPPIGLDVPVAYAAIRSEQRLVGVDEPWQSVGAYAAAT
jgi:phthalate 4,5-dioxygenase oxygenase subunit